MNILFVCPAWDPAGCSFRQAQAINKYTLHKARHFRAIHTLYTYLDIGQENYNRDEFICLIEGADILHFAGFDHLYKSEHVWGFNWSDYIRKKITIFHDYCTFDGHWTERKMAKDCWDVRDKLGYSATFSSVPQACHVYNGSIYVPDLVDENDPEFMPSSKDFSELSICHFPTGDGNRKNTNELRHALLTENIKNTIARGIPSHHDVMNFRKTHLLGFDCLWRGFNGTTSIENFSVGTPTLCGIDREFDIIFSEYFKTDFSPFDKTNTVMDIINTIRKYKNNIELLKHRSIEVRKFMETHWSAKIIAENIIKEYQKL